MIGWPLKSNFIRRGLLSNTFGQVRHNADGSIRAHQGWDLRAAPGTRCYAVADGTVRQIKTVGDYGNTVVIEFQHQGHRFYAAYSHLSRIDVKVGKLVKRGEWIGLTGNTGNAASMRGEDCHLHFELRTIPAPALGLGGRLSPAEIFGQPPLHEAVMGDMV
jgi:peptidoglycan LD-endopeptidase LytH